MSIRNTFIAGVAVLAASATAVPSARASSHREAPLVSQDPCADNVDTYAWVTPASHDKLNLVSTYIPLEEPSGGPNFHQLCDDVLYAFHIVRGNASLDPVITYYIQMHTPRPAYVDPADLAAPLGGGKEFFIQLSGMLNQTYTIWKDEGGTKTRILAAGQVAPPNIGPRTYTVAGYKDLPTPHSNEVSYTDAYAAAFIANMENGEGRAWVGPRDDGFYVDLGGVFDLANLRGKGTAQDGVAGYNTHAIVLEIPTTKLTADGMPPGNTPSNDRTLIGVYAATYRQKASILRNNGAKIGVGPWVRVSRLGLPLINEAIIGLASKDYWNRSSPKDDVPIFGAYFLNPVIVRDADAVGVYAATMGAPMQYKTNRTDIIDVINLKNTPTPSAHDIPLGATGDVLRLDMAVDSGFPNGRSIPGAASNQEGADVTDVILSLALFRLENGINVKDGVDYNDKAFLTSMPWLALPWEGFSQGHGKPTP
jgi:uncharacterized protein DUF4331